MSKKSTLDRGSKSNKDLSKKISLSPLGARITNSWLKSPPMGPGLAFTGRAFSPNLAKILKYDKK